MPKKHTGLGKGLDALIPGGGENSRGVQRLPIDAIHPNPRQPRTRFQPEELEDLAASIREHGIIQPLIVTRGEQPGQYTLIAGERRLQAAGKAGLTEVPAILREASEQDLLELALIENVQRADLNPLETAEAYRQLEQDFTLSHEEIARRVGKSRSAVTNTLRLLEAPPSVQKAVLESLISEGHARALLGLSTAQAQAAALQTVITKGLTVRQTEELVRKLKGQKPAPQKTAPSPALRDIEERLRARLGTRVSLKHGKKGGTITLHYYSDEELEALLTHLLD
ncbi:MAG: ParB/RepB/Spo0J family partition protein [Anaerolineales bacterium]